MNKKEKIAFIKVSAFLIAVLVIVLVASYGLFTGVTLKISKPVFSEAQRVLNPSIEVVDSADPVIKVDSTTETDAVSADIITDFTAPDRSTTERTLRTFWWAAQQGDTKTALTCVDQDKVSQGRDGRDIHEHIDIIKDIPFEEFTVVTREQGASVRLLTYFMDYDMEQQEDGSWVIVSIHP